MNIKNFLLMSMILTQFSIKSVSTLHDLAVAIVGKDIDTVRQILDDGFDVNSQNEISGDTPIILTINEFNAAKAFVNRVEIENFYKEIIKLLLDRGADPTIKNRYYQSAIDLAKKTQNQELIKLIEEGSKLQRQKRIAEQKSKEIFDAIEISDINAIKKLGEKVSFIYVKDEKGNNPLHKAVSKGNEEIVGLILKIQPQLARIPNNRGETPIDLAANRPKILETLIKLGYKK
ncbi:ankyrin repeat domain-containing protein [Candidatus Dependentiae bacterium]|nr:ankyrin repeat domain-containing protein [Candidatus Dependentiae bacterium]